MSSSVASSVRRYAERLIKAKVIGKRFNTYRWSDGVSFCDDGRFLVQTATFGFCTKSENCTEMGWCDSVPIYELYVSGIEVDNPDKKFYLKINIEDIG